jgi:hypothetical protein
MAVYGVIVLGRFRARLHDLEENEVCSFEREELSLEAGTSPA